MTPKQLPRWKDCWEAHHAGAETALGRFIYNHEPAGDDKEARFRQQLADLINEVERNALTRARDLTLTAPPAKASASLVPEPEVLRDRQYVLDERVAELEQRLDTMSRALAGVEAMNRRLLELERMHGLTIARAH